MGAEVVAAGDQMVPAPVRRARFAVLAAFFAHGAIASSWVPLIPVVQQNLGLNDAALGFALLGPAVGTLASMPVVGPLLGRYGSRRVFAVTGMAYAVTLPLPVLAPSLPTLFLALVLCGACAGSSDVAMNAHAVVVETAYRRPLMSAFHGAWSLGSLATATLASVLAALGWTPLARAVVPAVVTLAGMALAARAMLPPQSREQARGQRFAWPSRHLLGLGLVAFCAFMAEGGIRNWSVLFLQHDLGTAPAVAAAGFAVFSLTMTIGRLAGDWVTARSAPDRVVRLGGALLAGALGAALLSDRTPVVLVGLALIGLALANILPLVFSAAGRVTDRGTGAAIAAVTTTGYVGYLVGPPAIGVTADHVTVRGGLGLVVVLGLILMALAPAVRPAPRAHTAAEG